MSLRKIAFVAFRSSRLPLYLSLFINRLWISPRIAPGWRAVYDARFPEGSMMLRQRLNDALKNAMRAKDERRVSTTRLILAALKDRDIAARGDGRPEGITDAEILTLLQTMVRQRRESIELYEKGARPELAEQEREEIAIIEEYLPRQLSDEELQD